MRAFDTKAQTWLPGGVIASLLSLSAALLAAAPVAAVPPAALVGSVGQAPWTEHRVIPGERLKEIAARHGVSVRDLVRWNQLDAERPRIRINQKLRVRSRFNVPNRSRTIHKVRAGDTWSRIARKYRVKSRHLRKRWNPKAGDLRPGDRIFVWIEDSSPAAKAPGERAETTSTSHATAVQRAEPALLASRTLVMPQELPAESTREIADPYPIVEVSGRSMSTGRPGRGRLRRGVQLPRNDALYRRRDATRSYASSHTIGVLQHSIAAFRRGTGYRGEVVFNDLSKRRGGRLSPHNSHQSGRDADIRLLLVPGTEQKNGTGKIDWDATWALMSALIETGHVQYIFLSRSKQRRLRRAALRAGVDEETLASQLQYPGRGRRAIIRDSPGHDRHFHVRIDCGAEESRCHN